MAIHKKGLAHWEGDLEAWQRHRVDRKRGAEPAALRI